MSNDLVRAAVDLAWSHWVGLGVSGTARAPNTAVDPEPLMLLTIAVMEEDGRLRDEVGDWYAQFNHHLSGPRLNAFVGEEKQAIFQAWWSYKGKFSGKSRLDNLESSARSLLRFRCIFGANARAEVLLDLITRGHDSSATALELSALGYSKRNIALLMEDLVLSGIVEAASEGNRARYRIARSKPLCSTFGALPERSGQWHLRLTIATAFVELARKMKSKSATAQGVEAQKLMARWRPQLEQLPLPPIPMTIAETYWETLQRWMAEHLLAEPPASRGLERMIEGVWMRDGVAVRRPSVFGSAVLPRVGDQGDNLRCLDLVQVPTISPPGDWAWAVLSISATNVYAHTIGLERGEAWNFVTWEDDQPIVYRAEFGDDVPPEKLEKLFGSEASGRARKDQPAVQLRLRRQV